MEFYVECYSCNNIDPLDVIECSTCSEYLVNKKVTVHAAFSQDKKSTPILINAVHEPHEEKYRSYVHDFYWLHILDAIFERDDYFGALSNQYFKQFFQLICKEFDIDISQAGTHLIKIYLRVVNGELPNKEGTRGTLLSFIIGSHWAFDKELTDTITKRVSENKDFVISQFNKILKEVGDNIIANRHVANDTGKLAFIYLDVSNKISSEFKRTEK